MEISHAQPSAAAAWSLSLEGDQQRNHLFYSGISKRRGGACGYLRVVFLG